MKMYYWAENLEDYKSDNEPEYTQTLKIKRLNFFIGRNNAGKSRFLRTLFTSESSLKDNNFYNTTSIIQDLKDTINTSNQSIWMGNSQASNYKPDLINYIDQILKFPIFPKAPYKKNFNSLFEKIKLYRFNNDVSFQTKTQNIFKLISKNDFLFPEEKSKIYIPVLRGMRPLLEVKNIHPFTDRTIKDYFDEQKDKLTIISGENLYEELSRCLLGEPEERKLIRDYEQKLSQYFFDNQTISLIPKYKNDVVYIKIGEDKQFPIYQLGDGLQQTIILTYEAFIKKDEIHAFFIEEPELHMHAGMVRQLMNFYLNETKHYYFFTTHSNHLLDMVDESDDVIIQKFSKNPDGSFQINRCDKDRDLLASLGVKPSSVYLANCTIWVEGITDRLYIIKYMQKYLADLKTTNAELYKKYLRFMPNYHYTFVEYAGSNLTHWNFDDEYTDETQDNGLNALAVCSNMLLLADGDIQSKGNRVNELIQQLTQENFLLLECKEIENTLPDNIIIATAKDKFSRMQANATYGFDISLLDSISGKLSFYHSKNGIGKILDNSIRLPNAKENYCFSDKSGTIKEKLKFCRLILSTMDTKEWQLTPSAINICEKIFNHIEKCNQ